MQENKTRIDCAEELERGEAFFQSGNLAEASRCFERILDIEPNNADALNNMGVVLYHSQQPEEALSTFMRVLELDPRCREAVVNVCGILEESGQLDTAQPFLKEFARDCPEDEEIKDYLRKSRNKPAPSLDQQVESDNSMEDLSDRLGEMINGLSPEGPTSYASGRRQGER